MKLNRIIYALKLNKNIFYVLEFKLIICTHS